MRALPKFIPVLLLLLLPCILATHAQQPTLPDSSNFISYFDRILIKANVSTQSDQYTLIETQGPGLQLRTNNEFKTFLSLDYEFIGFSYGFSPKLLNANNDDYLKGRSSLTDFKLQLLPGQWLQTLGFRKTRGYYIENTGDFVAGWQKNKDPYVQLESLTTRQWSGSTSFVFNKDFSFKNLLYQTQWQKRSAGSVVPTLYYDHSRFAFDYLGTAAEQRDVNLRLGLGYYYTFIIARRFFVSPNLVPAAGISFSKSRTTEHNLVSTERKEYYTGFLDGGLKIGFNSAKWVVGAGLNFNANWYREDTENMVANSRLFGIVYLGYRFNTPKFITDTYKAVMSLVPF